MSVSQFVAYVNDAFKAIWDPTAAALEGEVSEFRISQGQWVNFNLKDGEALVSVFMVANKLRVPVSDGLHVRLYGYPRIYPKYGKFSFSAERVELVGEGALQKALAALRAKLDAEGLFDPSRKRELPRFPSKVALIASRESAAYGDFVRIVNERWRGIEIDSYHAIVQGEKAPDSIVGCIEFANREGGYDALVITRGGGSLEELMAFNDERVVRAIHASKAPTLAAIGHERDLTLAEEAADVRGSTPTDAARRLVPDRRDIVYEISVMEQGIALALQETIVAGHERADQAIRAAEHWLKDMRHDVERSSARALEAAPRWFESIGQALDSLERLIRSLDPTAVLRRGFAIVSSSDGRIISAKAQAKAGDRVSIRLRDGSVGARIEGQQPNLL